MARLMIRLIGPFQVSLDSCPVSDFESNKARTLLAYLAVESSQPHTRQKLVDLFWPEMPARRAESYLTRALYNLRLLLDDHLAQPPFLLRTRDAVQFNPAGAYWLDVQAFGAFLAAGSRVDQPECESIPWWCQQLQAAVDLYRGDFLDGMTFENSLAFDRWALAIRQRLQRQALSALRLLVDYYTECGELARALPFASRQVLLDPLGEPACRQLISLQIANNQPGQALAQYRRLKVMLAEELSADPEPQTAALREGIHGSDGSRARFPVLLDNMPILPTPMIGRSHELSELKARLSSPDCRLLTILGPGGSGKTRLAMEVARSSREVFRHGICFVPLNSFRTPASIAPAVVQALDLPRQDQADLQTQLVDYLRDKHCLLVLDGFEHLLQGASRLADILRHAPGVKILVTSRAGLNIKGEQLFSLSGLCYPAGTAEDDEILKSDAVQMLVAALRGAQPDFEPRRADARRLLQICRQVQGMPLSLLLAGSWGASMRLGEIAEQVSQGQDFFAYDWRDQLARQRSLQVVIDHTWNLLSERERVILQSLAVFRGAFSRQAARIISGALLPELRAVVNRALVQEISQGWYEIHPVLREYGRRELARSSRVEKLVCNRHCEYYLRKLAHLGKLLGGAQQAAALEMIDLEFANYRAAWNWAAGQAAAAHLAPTADAMCLYYDLSLRYQEGESACRIAYKGLSKSRESAGIAMLLARILTWHSRFSRLVGSFEIAKRCMAEARDQLDKAGGAEQDHWGIARALDDLDIPESHPASKERMLQGHS